MKTKLQIRLAAAKNSRLGRILCRLAGDESGSQLMEYVILGVLIAAAVVPAAIYFGKGINGNLTVMHHATTGNTDAAKQQATQNYQTAASAATTSEADRKSLSGGAGNNGANK